MKALQGLFRLNAAMNEDISAEDRGETCLGEGQAVHVAETHGLATLRMRDLTSHLIQVQSNRRELWQELCKLAQEAAGSTTGIKDNAGRLVAAPSMERCNEIVVQAAEPPHFVFDLL
jgi:hypothetical protein